MYSACLERAKLHLELARRAFCGDPALHWTDRDGDVAKAQVQVWVDALVATLEYQRALEAAATVRLTSALPIETLREAAEAVSGQETRTSALPGAPLVL